MFAARGKVRDNEVQTHLVGFPSPVVNIGDPQLLQGKQVEGLVGEEIPNCSQGRDIGTRKPQGGGRSLRVSRVGAGPVSLRSGAIKDVQGLRAPGNRECHAEPPEPAESRRPRVGCFSYPPPVVPVMIGLVVPFFPEELGTASPQNASLLLQ